ncbi:MAG: hypothetical protein GWP16_00070, partial [Nitrospirae bacterium]|nr:hypothetical protein [Nitrospirota bacterium]
EATYREALLDQILEGQTIDEAEYEVLAGARAEAIRSYLVDTAGADSTQIEVLPDPVTVTEGEDRVRCQLVLTGKS